MGDAALLLCTFQKWGGSHTFYYNLDSQRSEAQDDVEVSTAVSVLDNIKP